MRKFEKGGLEEYLRFKQVKLRLKLKPRQSGKEEYVIKAGEIKSSCIYIYKHTHVLLCLKYKYAHVNNKSVY